MLKNIYIAGSAIAFNGSSKKVLCGCFPHSSNILVEKNTLKVDMGPYYRGFDGQEYSFHYFISGFDLSYQKNKDHHVKEINISIQGKPNLICEKNRIYAELIFNAIIKDNTHNTSDITQNKINGFVIAIRNQSVEDESE